MPSETVTLNQKCVSESPKKYSLKSIVAWAQPHRITVGGDILIGHLELTITGFSVIFRDDTAFTFGIQTGKFHFNVH